MDHEYYWLRAKYIEKPSSENSDLVLLEREKYITITPLQNRQEHCQCFKKLEEIFLKKLNYIYFVFLINYLFFEINAYLMELIVMMIY